MDKVNHIGGNKQLLIDEMLIESSSGVQLVMNPPYQTGEEIIAADKSWEQGEGVSIGGYNTIMQEGDMLRLWYQLNHKYPPLLTWGDREASHSTCYAESEDGINFMKPELNLHDLHGTKANNVVIPGPFQGGTVWIDPNDQGEYKYKIQGNGPGGLNFYGSPDGIHWDYMHTVSKKSPLRPGNVDSRSTVLWDEQIQRYIIYTRCHFPAEDPAPKGTGGYRGHRGVRRLESEDLVHWENEAVVLEPDDVDCSVHSAAVKGQPPVDYYTGMVFRYPDESGIWMMMTAAYWHWYDRSPDVVASTGYNLGPNALDIRLLMSRDGKKFEWLGDRKPFLRLGLAGSFYSRRLYEMAYPIQMGDEIWVYYTGANREHGPAPSNVLDPEASEERGAITRAVMRRDGFVSADVEYTGGEFTTPLISFTGERMELNLDTSGGGEVRIEFLDPEGNPIAGYTLDDCRPLNGNSTEMSVRWGDSEDVSNLAEQPVRIRFVMNDCKLYSFQFVK